MKQKSILRIKKVLLVLIILIAAFLILDIALRNRVFINSIATTLYKMGKTDYAARLWSQKLDPHDKDPIPEANLAKNLYRKGLHDEAQKMYGQAIDEAKDFPGLAYDHGNAQYRKDELDEALQSYLDAMLADENDQDAKSNYELVLSRQGYKIPKPEDEEEEQESETPEQKGDFENTLNALDQMEPYLRNRPTRDEENWQGRWW